MIVVVEKAVNDQLCLQLWVDKVGRSLKINYSSFRIRLVVEGESAGDAARFVGQES